LSGEHGVDLIDAKGIREGLVRKIFKIIDALGTEHDESRVHIDALREGKFVLIVSVQDDDAVRRARDVFMRYGIHVRYYTKWTTENLID
jgi:hypothetical protein